MGNQERPAMEDLHTTVAQANTDPMSSALGHRRLILSPAKPVLIMERPIFAPMTTIVMAVSALVLMNQIPRPALLAYLPVPEGST